MIHINLLDVRKCQLVDSFTSLSASASNTTDIVFKCSCFLPVDENSFHSLLKSYLDLVDSAFKSSRVVHLIRHHIVMFGPPIFSYSRRFAPDWMKKAKTEFNHML